MKEYSDDTLIALIGKHLTGEATTEESQELQQWIDASDENRETFEQFKKTLQLVEGPEASKERNVSVPQINIEAEWQHFKKKVDLPISKTVAMPKTEVAPASSNWLKIAAAIILVAIATFTVRYFITGDGTVNLVAENETSLHTLPDGSTVTLNLNSSLSYESHFGEGTRSVVLNGEAFFEVQKDEANPFVINTSSSQITVLGTSFNVRAYRNNTETEVVVNTGKVKFASDNSSVELEAGERGTLQASSGEILKAANTDGNFLSWKTKVLTFENAGLDEVVAAINRAYDAEITIKTDVPADCQLNVTFKQQSLESLINVLENTLDLTITRNGDQIEITEIGCEAES